MSTFFFFFFYIKINSCIFILYLVSKLKLDPPLILGRSKIKNIFLFFHDFGKLGLKKKWSLLIPSIDTRRFIPFLALAMAFKIQQAQLSTFFFFFFFNFQKEKLFNLYLYYSRNIFHIKHLGHF